MKSQYEWTGKDIKLADCILCRHKYQAGGFCEAFPQGIPAEILTGEINHKKPYLGDNGIQFEGLEYA